MVEPLQDDPADPEVELQRLERSLNQLKREYEQYFADSRSREPTRLRSELRRLLRQRRSVPIRNTAIRFRLAALCDRFQAFERQWDRSVRGLEAGTDRRSVFRSRLRDSANHEPTGSPQADSELFDAYRTAASSCGQSLEGLTRQQFQQAVRRQATSLQKKLGDQPLRFDVVVSEGRARLRARPLVES